MKVATLQTPPFRAVAAVAVMIIAVLVTGVAADAHAVLEQSTPAAGAVLAAPPKEVDLRFSESVRVEPDAVRIYDDRLRRVDLGGTAHPHGRSDSLVVRLRPGTGTGTFTVTWRVTSADSHVVSAGFTFAVGAPSTVTGAVPGLSANHAAGALLGATRGVGYAGLVASAGVLLFVVLMWPAGQSRPGVRRTIRTGAGLLVVATVAAMLLQQVYSADRPLSHLLDGPVLRNAVSGRFGAVMSARLVLVAALAAAAALLMARSRRPGDLRSRPALPGVVLLLSTGLVVTWPLAGHASSGSQAPLAVIADAVHVAAMTFWLGGLLVLVPLAAVAEIGTLRELLPRFSPVALGCVGVLVGTGLYQTWRDVGTPPALPHTDYGRLLLVKLALVAGLVALGNLARLRVRRDYAAVPATGAASPVSVAALRRGLVAEVALGLCVLAVTSALTGVARARDSYAPPYTTTSRGPFDVRVHVVPAGVGPATVDLAFRTASGAAQPVQQVTGTLSLPARDLGPLPVTFTPVDRSHARASVQFAVKGRWDLHLTVQTSPIDAVAYDIDVVVK